MSRPTYFLSDLHIDRPDGARTERLLRFLRARRGEADAVYLVGDVFDFWLGYRAVIFRAFFPLLRSLAELVESGVRVVVFSGNHDPDLGDFLGELGIETRDAPLSLTLGGKQVHVEHGDLIDPRGAWHRAVCRFARNRGVRAMARAVHPELAWRLAQLYARQPHHYGAPLPAGLLTDWFPARLAAGDDVAVIGHYHRAVVHRATHAGREGLFFALGDWRQQFTYLRFDGRFELLRDRGPDLAPLVLPEGDHGPDPGAG